MSHPADETPLEPASYLTRVGALLVDVVPAYAPVAAFAAAAAHWWNRGRGGETDLEPWAGITVIVLGLWPVAYFALRRTLGKRVLRLHVDGPGRRRSLRGLWSPLPLLVFAWPWLGLPLLVDAVWPLRERGRSLHDRLAGTRVLHPVRESPIVTALRRAGAENRRAFAASAFALEPSIREDPQVIWSLDQARRQLERAADDPYAALETWSYVSRARTAPVSARIRDELAEDPDYVDPEIVRLFDEIDDAYGAALQRFAPIRPT